MYCSIRDINNISLLSEDFVKEVILDGTEYSIIDVLELSKKYLRVVYDLSKIENIDDTHIKEFKTLMGARDNIVFCVASLERAKTFLDERLPIFLSPNNATVADSLERLYTLAKVGFTDAYVTGELAFKMSTVKKIADEFGIKIRILPNMATSSGFTNWFEKEALTDFWIRPEDLHMYEPYVDCVEFAGSHKKQVVLYDIYFIGKTWKGDLSQIINGLEPLDNRGLLPQFTEARLNCGKKCLLNMCHSCDRHKALSELIIENNLKLETKESI